MSQCLLVEKHKKHPTSLHRSRMYIITKIFSLYFLEGRSLSADESNAIS